MRLNPGILSRPALGARACPMGAGLPAGWLPAPIQAVLLGQGEPDLSPWQSHVLCGLWNRLLAGCSHPSHQVRPLTSRRETLPLGLLALSFRLPRMCKVFSEAQYSVYSETTGSACRWGRLSSPASRGQLLYAQSSPSSQAGRGDIRQRQEPQHWPPDIRLLGASSLLATDSI